MTGYIIAAGIVGWGSLITVAAIRAIENDSPFWLGVALLMLILGFGFLIEVTREETQKGPCLNYETGMQYNPTTKTTMPYRYCTERGEWIE